MKALTTVAAAFLLAAPSAPSAKPYAHDEAAIVKVECEGGWGSAVKIGPSEYITAAHVVNAGGCTVDGVGITVTRVNDLFDYATFTGPTNNHVIPVSCGGFDAGKIYVARGYPGGFPGLVRVPWLMTELTDQGQRLAIGDAIPGMSGGALIDRRGRVTGIVNRRVASRSLPLSATSACL